MKVKPVSADALKRAYNGSCKELGLDPDKVPHLYIDLSALASRKVLDAFCEENELELPKESKDELVDRLVKEGLLDEEQAAVYRLALGW